MTTTLRTVPRPRNRHRSLTALTATGLAALLGLTACSDPGSSAATGAAEVDIGSGTTVDLSPDRERPGATASEEAAALVPEAVSADGRLTVATVPYSAPLSVYATDNATPVGSDPDIASALADSLGLELELVPVAWEDWPLGLESGKYEAVISNVTVTDERKQKYDMASYREDKLGFYVTSDSDIQQITEAKDVAGLRVIVGSGTNQEKVLMAWDRQNRKAGLDPVDLQYYEDDSAAGLALQAGRADATFGPNSTGAYKAAQTGQTRLVGLVAGGWPDTAHISVAVQKGTGLGEAAQSGLDHLIETGVYGQILQQWGLAEEGIDASALNPPGLKD
ncbi:ABC transporter substrate-binding protein [Citricoccus sp.]|uniref:ABC transporter substrate-binding protein n=1 Tax=Citricoccus sp. TaxID=1978372 RepID=UPI00262C525D|nr:ABC transporter substrate-binding protein [Citricoccus sp.]HRO94606.1 ABC transporter substrate-binding protein [Citricoccus sp.]